MAVALGAVHAAFVDEDGAAWAMGSGGRGQLGLGDWQPKNRPSRIGAAAFGGARAVQIAAGAYHTAVAVSDGSLWSWGRGYEGQLGHGDTERRSGPSRLGPEGFGGAPVLMVACGFGHTLVLTLEGEVCVLLWGH